jgi:superfamily II DNA/RNA helicase
LLVRLANRHERVLAFDRHLISLVALRRRLNETGHTVLLATGANEQQRKRLQRSFAPESQERGIALCSDAMNEGLNLQGASAIVHLDLPTTLRVAEQRVGRVDRMNSPHAAIEAYWPNDGQSFATRANEKLARRVEESALLLGSNLPVPDLSATADDRIISVEEHIKEYNAPEAETWDGIHDAFDAVRSLVRGEDSLISQAAYARHRTTTSRVLARVAPVDAATPWAFFAVRAPSHGAPRWILIDHEAPSGELTQLPEIAARLRHHLSSEPEDRPLDEAASALLDQFIDAGARAEHRLLPRRMQRGLDQLRHVATTWATTSRAMGSEEEASAYDRLAALATPSPTNNTPDPYLIAQRWLNLVDPMLNDHRQVRRPAHYVLLRDITPRLLQEPVPLNTLERCVRRARSCATLAERVSACIIGVSEN